MALLGPVACGVDETLFAAHCRAPLVTTVHGFSSAGILHVHHLRIVQDERYFTERVARRIDGEQVVFLSSVGPKRRGKILGGAAALLHPIAFDEAFGLSVVESVACATPVVAYRRGRCPRLPTRTYGSPHTCSAAGHLPGSLGRSPGLIGFDRSGVPDWTRLRFEVAS